MKLLLSFYDDILTRTYSIELVDKKLIDMEEKVCLAVKEVNQFQPFCNAPNQSALHVGRHPIKYEG